MDWAAKANRTGVGMAEGEGSRTLSHLGKESSGEARGGNY